MNGGMKIEGPGIAALLLAGVSIYTAGFSDVTNAWRWNFWIFAFIALAAAVIIEIVHGR